MTNEIRDETDIDDFVGNAERLIAMYGEDLRFCHAFKKWLVWDGMRWAVDDTDQARRLAKQAMLEFLKLAIERGGDEKAEKFARASLDTAPAVSEIGEVNAQHTLLFTGAVDIKACRILLGSRPRVITWRHVTTDQSKHRVDHLSRIATVMLGEVFASPVRTAHQTVGSTTMAWSGSKRPTEADVVASSRKEASWLEPVPISGIDVSVVWNKVLEETKDKPSDSREVRRLLHDRAYRRVLRPNQDHEVVRWMFRLHDSGKTDDASLSKIIFNLLLRSAIHSSVRERYHYEEDHDRTAQAMIDACEYMLLLHSEGSSDVDA